MNDVLKKLTPVITLLVICGVMVGAIAWWIGSGKDISEISLTNQEGEELEVAKAVDQLEEYNVNMSNRSNPVAVLETNMGTIEIELFEDTMPITAGNFKKLVNEGFYDGVKFHRVIEGFMIQGGDPITKTNEVLRYGTGGPGYAIPDEHIKGPLLTNVRGTISMANSGPESGGSQFFINLVDNTNLDFDKQPLTSKHPVFGQVVEGMDIVDAIGQVQTSASDLPLEDVVIEKASIR